MDYHEDVLTACLEAPLNSRRTWANRRAGGGAYRAPTFITTEIAGSRSTPFWTSSKARRLTAWRPGQSRSACRHGQIRGSPNLQPRENHVAALSVAVDAALRGFPRRLEQFLPSDPTVDNAAGTRRGK